MKITHFAVAGLFLLLAAGIYLTVQSDMDGRMAEQKSEYERMRAESDKKYEQLEKAIREQKAPGAVADASADIKATVAGKSDAATAAAKKGIASGKTALNPPDAGTEAADAVDRVKQGLEDVSNNLTSAANDVTGEISGADETAEQRLLDKEQREVLNTSGVGAERIALDNAKVTSELREISGTRMTTLQSQILAQPAIARVDNANAAANEGFVILDRGRNANLAKGDAFAVRRGTALIGRVVVGETIEETRCVAEVLPRHLVKGMVLAKGDEIIKFDQ